LAAVLAAAAVPASAQNGCGEREISYKSSAVSSGDRETFDRELRASIARACAWWGASYDGKFTIAIEDTRGPSMALVPAWRGARGEMLFRANMVRLERAAIQHEVIHVFAPNANRFLAEGLAVYAHEHLGGNKAYPNNGVDLHHAAKALEARADLTAMDRIATPQQLASAGLTEDEAYIVAGSFVRFLSERHGIEKFRALYALTPLVPYKRDAGQSARWTTIYGVAFERLVADWRGFPATI
jgi:hypothetical protein